MFKVKLTAFAGPDNSRSAWHLARQTPGCTGQWGEYQFYINQQVPECDYWVVYGGLFDEERTGCPAENTVLFTYEPPTVRAYHPAFAAQFGTVITCHTNLNHPRVVQRQQAQYWGVGVSWLDGHEGPAKPLDYDTLSAMPRLDKLRPLSVICSNNTMTEGHRQRVRFVEKLKAHFGSTLDVFGRGFQPVVDKWDAIAPYQYHIALENCSVPHYWSEKLADAYLAGAYPIYFGCPNLTEYFRPEGFTAIDLRNADQAIATIEEVLARGLYERRQAELLEARRRVLDEYNLFPMLVGLFKQLPAARHGRSPVRIRDERHFLPRPFPLRWARQARTLLRRASRLWQSR
jgi:hypothetical protein